MHQAADFRPHVATVLLDAIVGLLQSENSTAIDVLFDHALAVIPFLLQSSCHFADYAESLANLVSPLPHQISPQANVMPGLSMAEICLSNVPSRSYCLT